jgi:GSH-dependent disulfide-bond oxidoreductase
MLDVHFWPTPNGKKVTILLEELGLDYEIVPCNIGRGDQFKPDFLKINPNHRMPVLVDHAPKGGGAPISVFESGAIMMYLAEKKAAFFRRTRAANTRSLSGSLGRWPTRARNSANAAISAARARRQVT